MREQKIAIPGKRFAVIWIGVAVLSAGCGLLKQQAIAQAATGQMEMTKDGATANARMAPLEQYLTERTAEIELARSAAPESISRDADVMVLGRRGFETASKGNNGFVCLVERSWTAAAEADFWDPKVRVPICYNGAGAHSILLRNLKRTELIMAGRTPAQTDQTIFAAVDKKELPPMEPGAICYMMSKQGYGGATAPHWPAHLMFYFSGVAPAMWGANLTGSPVVAMSDGRERLTEFVVAVGKWSDGTEDRMENR